MAASERLEFGGEVVLVTGAGRGLGRVYAVSLAARGARVAVNDLDGDAAVEVAAEITASGSTALAVEGDILSDSARIVDECFVGLGRLNALVNNAGVAHSAAFDARSAEDVARLMRVHTVGTASMTAAAWDALQASHGRVVNVTSGAIFGLPGSTAYAAAKGGILGFTRALASEQSTSGVTVNAVMPMARTRMYELSGGIAGSDEDQLMSTYFPAEAVSPVVVYLAWRGVPFNGETFEVAGSAVSRIVFASGPIVEISAAEDMVDAEERLWRPELDTIDSLVTSVGRKMAFSMDAETADSSHKSVRHGGSR